MSWSVVGFGKHKGKTLPQIVFSDPDWFFWAMENKVFAGKGSLDTEAVKINELSRKIQIKNNSKGGLQVEYLIHQPTGKFAHFDIVSDEIPLHQGGSPAFRLNVIDMSVPRQIAQYDKFGCKSLLSSIKTHVFGNSKKRLTKKLAEEFFDDASNFA